MFPDFKDETEKGIFSFFTSDYFRVPTNGVGGNSLGHGLNQAFLPVLGVFALSSLLPAPGARGRKESMEKWGRASHNFCAVPAEPQLCENLVHNLYHPGGCNSLTLTEQSHLSVLLGDGCFLSLWGNCYSLEAAGL